MVLYNYLFITIGVVLSLLTEIRWAILRYLCGVRVYCWPEGYNSLQSF